MAQKPKIFRTLRMLVTVIMIFISICPAIASSSSDSLTYRILFQVNSSTVQADLADNAAVLSDCISTYNELAQDKDVSDIHLVIRGNASVEGDTGKSMTLAERRALALYDYFTSRCSIADSAIIVMPVQSVIVEAERMLSGYQDTIPGIDIPAIRRITRTVPGLRIRQAFKEIDKDGKSTNWEWYKKNILDPTRFAEICLTFERTTSAVDTAAASPLSISTVQNTAETAATIAPVRFVSVEDVPTVVQDTVKQEPPRPELRLGTNVLYDAVTVANMYVEYCAKGHFAFNLSATFSPWDIRKPDIKIRTLLFQPELRWYFRTTPAGHYVGIEGHYGWYNVALGGMTRYQDLDGRTPLWGAGLTYGYVLPFSEHWGMDFSLSAGYANYVYDGFYNVENGAWHFKSSGEWWGPTKAGVSIYYQF